MNVVAELQARRPPHVPGAVDIQNLLNYAAYNNPITDPTNTNFGKVTTAVALGRRDALLQLRGEVHVLIRDRG